VQVLQGPMLSQGMMEETRQELRISERRGVVGRLMAWLRRLSGR
jgi:hypothetical protein